MQDTDGTKMQNKKRNYKVLNLIKIIESSRKKVKTIETLQTSKLRERKMNSQSIKKSLVLKSGTGNQPNFWGAQNKLLPYQGLRSVAQNRFVYRKLLIVLKKITEKMSSWRN